VTDKQEKSNKVNTIEAETEKPSNLKKQVTKINQPKDEIKHQNLPSIEKSQLTRKI
jgi:hypothetical protein